MEDFGGTTIVSFVSILGLIFLDVPAEAGSMMTESGIMEIVKNLTLTGVLAYLLYKSKKSEDSKEGMLRKQYEERIEDVTEMYKERLREEKEHSKEFQAVTKSLLDSIEKFKLNNK